jgi:hypothetical protein
VGGGNLRQCPGGGERGHVDQSEVARAGDHPGGVEAPARPVEGDQAHLGVVSPQDQACPRLQRVGLERPQRPGESGGVGGVLADIEGQEKGKRADRWHRAHLAGGGIYLLDRPRGLPPHQGMTIGFKHHAVGTRKVRHHALVPEVRSTPLEGEVHLVQRGVPKGREVEHARLRAGRANKSKDAQDHQPHGGETGGDGGDSSPCRGREVKTRIGQRHGTSVRGGPRIASILRNRAHQTWG